MEIRHIKSVTELRKTWNFLKGMGVTQVMHVPIRRRGMTGSGTPKKCHSNVRLLVKKYGGKVVLGYTLNYTATTDGCIHFLHHSVWETPEGNIVDVTYHLLGQSSFPFVSLKKFNPLMEEFSTPPNVVFTKDNRIRFVLELGEEICVTQREMKRGAKTIRDLLIEPVRVTFDEEETGGFTKPSTATGKYFEQATEVNHI